MDFAAKRAFDPSTSSGQRSAQARHTSRKKFWVVFFFCFFIFLSIAPLSAQRPVRLDSVVSSAIGGTRTFAILLPKDPAPSRKYPVLYLLHGYSGGYKDWTERTDIEQYVDTMGLIVVLPDGENSWYVNAFQRPTLRYEDYFLTDLMTAVESRYAVDTTRRAIAGLSMGGYGALLYGFKHPDRFRFAGSLSGAFSIPHAFGDTAKMKLGGPISESVKKGFGPPDGPHARSNDVYLLLRSAPSATMPFVYMAAGIQDGFRPFLPAHREFADSLRAAGIPYEYHETPGTHSWKYWDNEIQPLLRKMAEVLSKDGGRE